MPGAVTPEYIRSAQLVKVVKAMTLSHDLPAPTARQINGLATAIRLLVEVSAKNTARSQTERLEVAVKALDLDDGWAKTLTGYIETLRRVL